LGQDQRTANKELVQDHIARLKDNGLVRSFRNNTWKI
ncbi:hypothetical protein L915_03324, partial [Phytophthora nicotianae]